MSTVAVTDVEITNISKELTRLWDEAQGQDKIRASLFNLIVYVQGNQHVDYFQQMIQKVVSKFPSRVIFIVADERPGEDYLKTSVSSVTVGEGDLKIFCETIKIDVGGKHKERVPFLVTPQILADLPVYLLWAQDPSADNTILPHLEPYATRIIFASDESVHLQDFSRSVYTLSDTFACEVGDLHWSALAGWRKLLANFFNTESLLTTLEAAHHITITYGKGRQQIEAAYLQAWLASRMEWKFKEFELIEGNVRICYKRPTHDVVILIKPEDGNHALLSLDIESKHRDGHFSFHREATSRQVHIQASDCEKCELPVIGYISGAGAGQEIIDEIFYPSPKHHYREMLETLSQIPWRL